MEQALASLMAPPWCAFCHTCCRVLTDLPHEVTFVHAMAAMNGHLTSGVAHQEHHIVIRRIEG